MDLIFILLCVLSVFFTIIHAVEELIGDGGPLWDNFGRIVGVRLPYFLGFILFTAGLAGILIFCSFRAYCWSSPIFLSLLFGARVGDTLISHWGLYWTGLSDPNPGLYSTALYVTESFLIYLFAGDMLLLSYILLGAAFFASVLPTLWLAGRIIPSWRI